jgi:hypothetical protein
MWNWWGVAGGCFTLIAGAVTWARERARGSRLRSRQALSPVAGGLALILNPLPTLADWPGAAVVPTSLCAIGLAVAAAVNLFQAQRLSAASPSPADGGGKPFRWQ